VVRDLLPISLSHRHRGTPEWLYLVSGLACRHARACASLSNVDIAAVEFLQPSVLVPFCEYEVSGHCDMPDPDAELQISEKVGFPSSSLNANGQIKNLHIEGDADCRN